MNRLILCPICGQEADSSGRRLHRCEGFRGSTPPNPEQMSIVLPPAGSRGPLLGAIAVVVGLCVGAVLMIPSLGGGNGTSSAAPASTNEPDAVMPADNSTTPIASTTSVASTTTVAASTSTDSTPVVSEVSAAEPVPATTPPVEVSVVATGCEGSTDSGTVPTAFLVALTQQVGVTSCRFSGRWMLAFWDTQPGVAEAALFNVDQSLDQGLPLPLLRNTPVGCIVDRVGDATIGTALAAGFPGGKCV